MATSNASEIEELVTCQICLYEYDRETRKPKFLQCAHTICLLCFQAARQQDTITCPFCRRCTSKDNTSNGEEWILPTNNYVLELLRLNGTPVLNPSLSDAVSTELADAEEDAEEDAEQLRIALAMSSLEMNEDEALNEALYQSLLSQQQEQDIPGSTSASATPRTNRTRVHVNSSTPSVSRATSRNNVSNTSSNDISNEDFFFAVLILSALLYYAVLLFWELFEFFWHHPDFLSRCYHTI
uniref:RING-type domain-containing protein n=1 Tax=Daphnia galeata TaxID=27404 RepID=A0A8J2S031_9CRUS|nr:unnamed protein product [Daphnia galeata]